jgi:hypothetical protein
MRKSFSFPYFIVKVGFKEVTRANHEYVARYEALRGDTANRGGRSKSLKELAVTLDVTDRKGLGAVAA